MIIILAKIGKIEIYHPFLKDHFNNSCRNLISQSIARIYFVISILYFSKSKTLSFNHFFIIYFQWPGGKKLKKCSSDKNQFKKTSFGSMIKIKFDCIFNHLKIDKPQ